MQLQSKVFHWMLLLLCFRLVSSVYWCCSSIDSIYRRKNRSQTVCRAVFFCSFFGASSLTWMSVCAREREIEALLYRNFGIITGNLMVALSFFCECSRASVIGLDTCRRRMVNIQRMTFLADPLTMSVGHIFDWIGLSLSFSEFNFDSSTWPNRRRKNTSSTRELQPRCMVRFHGEKKIEKNIIKNQQLQEIKFISQGFYPTFLATQLFS